MSTPTVAVARYAPIDIRGPCHWAIYISGGNLRKVMLQIHDDKGGAGYFIAPPMYDKEPQKSSHHYESIVAGTFLEENYEKVFETIKSTPVDNWVFEALKRLSEKRYLQWKDGAKENISKKREEKH
ncbi:hypothetical protein Alg130_09560 [Pyrenophora tritici-repentis]|nr:hypothetical protein Alg130_09560 [Pyrenophora tritici-repentis]